MPRPGAQRARASSWKPVRNALPSYDLNELSNYDPEDIDKSLKLKGTTNEFEAIEFDEKVNNLRKCDEFISQMMKVLQLSKILGLTF